MSSSEEIVALEIRYALYDFFGRHMKTLSALSVADMPVGKEDLNVQAQWNAWENELVALHTAVSFVAHVRTRTGKVWQYREDQIGEALMRARIDLSVNNGVLDAVKDK